MTHWLKSIKGWVAAGFLAGILTPSAPVWADTLDRVVAKVNSEIVTLSAVEDRFIVLSQKLLAAGQDQPSREKLMQQALDSIIDERLQVQEAKKMGFEVEEESVLKALDEIKRNNRISDEDFEAMLEREGRSLEAYKNVIRDQILVSRITHIQMGSRVKVGAKEIKKYYHKHRKDFWEPPKVKARHILFIIDENAPEKDIRLKKIKAKEILRRIRAGKDFAGLAKKYSEDVSAHSGGEIGIIEHGMMVPEFEEVVFRMKAGEVSGIVKTRYGLHIIKCDEVIPGQSKLFDQVKDEIQARLAFEREKKVYQSWMGELRERAFIEMSLYEGQSNPDRYNKKEGPQTASLAKDDFFNDDTSNSKAATHPPKKTRKPKLALDKESAEHRFVKKKLRYLKKLRDSKKISESEYQKRKKKLLRGF
ncbi:hypothetical protein UR09_01145 [Candidatus Nitromaritima sp. SCGC AAA799-A02]|nr:hypothetical protein UR09_01145 [Candidatus Nitromaritima sp. SCGC AAA799-A02]